MQLVAIVGTGTDIGKTWLSVHLVQLLRSRGISVAARKPVQSFLQGTESTDAVLLARATGQDPTDVCPEDWSFPIAMAPPMAAEVLGRSVPSIAELSAVITRWPEGTEIGLVETAGGVRSPLARDGDSADLVRSIEPEHIVLVADAGLGTINAVRLSVGALEATRTVVFLNRFDASSDLHERNRQWLSADGLVITTDVVQLVERVLGNPLPSAG